VTFTAAHARLAARGYAVCAILTGIFVIGAVALLIAAFGFHPADWQLLAVGGGLALSFNALGVFIWRQRLWAMLAALALTIALRYIIGPSSGPLLVGTIGVPVLFALLTAVGLMAHEPAAPSNARR